MAVATDQQLEQLKQKYQSLFQLIQQLNIRLTHVHVQDNKLFVQGDAPSDDAKNKVWDRIKIINPSWQNDLIADIRVTGSQGGPQESSEHASGSTTEAGSQGTRTYTVKPGDTLSKIAKEFYGSPTEYMKIFNANRDKLQDPNKIETGQELKIPS